MIEEDNVINEAEEIEFDISAGNIVGFAERRRRVSIEDEIDEIMDRWCSVKASKIAEICIEYDA